MSLSFLTGVSGKFTAAAQGGAYNLTSDLDSTGYSLETHETDQRWKVPVAKAHRWFVGGVEVVTLTGAAFTFAATLALSGKLRPPAQTAAADSAPLKFSASATLMAATEVGAVEFTGNELWVTKTGGTRVDVLTGVGDNLGNHTATTNLNLAGFAINNPTSINLTGAGTINNAGNINQSGVLTSTSGSVHTLPAAIRVKSAGNGSNQLGYLRHGASWVPELNASGGHSFTYTAQTGMILRYGRLVVLHFDIQLLTVTVGGTNGNLVITSSGSALPEASFGGSVPYVADINYETLTLPVGATKVSGDIPAGGDDITLYNLRDSNTRNVWTIGPTGSITLSNTTRLWGAVIYQSANEL